MTTWPVSSSCSPAMSSVTSSRFIRSSTATLRMRAGGPLPPPTFNVGTVITEEAHDAPLVAARELLHEADRGVARANHDDLRALLAAAAVERPLLEGAKRHAAGRHHRDEEQRIEDVLAVAEL